MYKQLKTWAALGLLACAAGCSKPDMVREDADAADSFAYRCNYGSPDYLHIEANEFSDDCFAPRSNEPTGLVRIPIDAATFATQCLVTIKESHAALARSACSPTDTTTLLPILPNDVITIDPVMGTDKFTLTRLRDQMVVPLKPGNGAGGGVPYLISDEIDGIDGVVYAVYLEVAGVQGSGATKELEKIYRIEMFDLKNATDPNGCRQHLPTLSSLTAACPTTEPVYARQTGTSTGGEPPPQ